MANSPPTDQERREAQVITKYLPSGYTASFDGSPTNLPDEPEGTNGDSLGSSSEASRPQTEESSLKLQGGDTHRELFMLDARANMQHRRATTFHYPRTVVEEEDEAMSVTAQLAPGGFRREFLRQRHKQDSFAAQIPGTGSFVEFLDLYGSFAGEDLADSDDEAVEEEEEDRGEEEEEVRLEQPSEHRPLLGRRTGSRVPRSAKASVRKTFFTLLKAFIGTGIMFLPKAFNNGGILFSSLTMLFISAISMLSFHLLLECNKQYGGGYGEIGQAIAGDKMRSLILGSITLSQLGFMSSGIVFVAENLLSFFKAVAGDHGSHMSTTMLVLLQLVVLVPLAFIRNIAKLGPVALLADICILIGVAYIYYYDIASLTRLGLNPTVVLFNSQQYTLTIGAAIFTFEGIGLILPIQSSMRKPQHFEWLLGMVMLIVTVLFTSVGMLCYATFGADTEIEIINNYPQNSRLVNVVQFLYSVAVLVGTPVQLFPAVRILEGSLFGHRSGKKNLRTKWIKNAFRAALVVFSGLVAIASAGNLDRFVALIGSLACVPLVYIYPPYLHYRGSATTRWAKAVDIALMVLGAVGMVYTTAVTIMNSFLS